MALVMLDDLTKAESVWRENNSVWQQRLSEWTAWRASQRMREKEGEKQKKSKPDDEAPQFQGPGHSWHESFNPSHPSPEFSFAGIKKYARAELDKDIAKLGWSGPPPQWMILALERGIGVHHAGMPKGYRALIERSALSNYIPVRQCSI